MAPLSHDLAGIILPHDYYGSHLDQSGKTIDNELEKRNFLRAVETLAGVWCSTIIDNKPVFARAEDLGKSFVPPEPSPTWLAKHVKQSRYALQIVKCLDQECCSDFKTNWMDVFPNRFLPYPRVVEYGAKGLQAVEPQIVVDNPKSYKFTDLKTRLLLESSVQCTPNESLDYLTPPFDLYCPSMRPKLKKCVCPMCGLYWPSTAAMKRHKASHKDDERAIMEIEFGEEMDVEEEETVIEIVYEEKMQVIADISKFSESPFEEIMAGEEVSDEEA